MSAMGTPARPTVARKRPCYLGPTNAAFKSLSRMGVRVGVVQVLAVPGRASGQPRSTPVSPVPLDGRRFLVAPKPHDRVTAFEVLPVPAAFQADHPAGGTMTSNISATEVVLPGLVEPDGFQLRQRVLPAPAPGEVVVAVEATGISFAEHAMRIGRYPGQPKSPDART